MDCGGDAAAFPQRKQMDSASQRLELRIRIERVRNSATGGIADEEALGDNGSGGDVPERSTQLRANLQRVVSGVEAVGGVHPLAQLVCFPSSGQNQDRDFDLVAFSKDMASTLRAKREQVPKEFLNAEKAPEKDRFLLLWAFRNGVRLPNDPETLSAVVGSKGTMWSADYDPPDAKGSPKRFTVRLVFSPSGRYSRDVLVDGNIRASVYGRCEPLQ